MQSLTRVAVFLSFASGLAAQWFVERDRSMYPAPFPTSGAAGGNTMVIDLDGDGCLDVFAGATTSNAYRNDGHGRFTLLASGVGGTWVLPQATGDYDGDGLTDYCTGSNLMRNQGGGVFAADPTLSFYTCTDRR